MATKSATKLVDALSARIHFGEMMEEAEKEKTRFLVSKRGKPKVVILSHVSYPPVTSDIVIISAPAENSSNFEAPL